MLEGDSSSGGRDLVCGQLTMQLRVRAKVVALIDFEVNLSLAVLVDGWLFNRDRAEHFSLIAALA